jgi:hypothetical protein
MSTGRDPQEPHRPPVVPHGQDEHGQNQVVGEDVGEIRPPARLLAPQLRNEVEAALIAGTVVKRTDTDGPTMRRSGGSQRLATFLKVCPSDRIEFQI